MIYMGGKRRIAKYILPIILADRKEGQWYVEPFAGGGNILEQVSGNRIGNDIDRYAIACLKAASEGCDFPSAVSREEYYHVKDNKELYPDYLVGYFGYCLSFGGSFFEGYAKRGKDGRDYVMQACRHMKIQGPKLKGITFSSTSYELLDIPKQSIIYCDPPYAKTKKYKHGDFDSEHFWEWCRNVDGKVFISEYAAPEDFECVWERNVACTFKTGPSGNATERLFTRRD